jgi:hypothetical protein
MNMLEEPEVSDQAAADSTATKLKRSPLTDPRALACSLVVHGFLLAIASVFAFQVAAPRIEPTAVGRVMKGELDATDNRANGDPGGTSGDPEGRAADLSAEPGIPAPLASNAAADALLSEILPTREMVEVPSQTLPGPSTNGLGMLNASGTGEGGASSGNSVGGGGKGGTGPGTEFFGVRDQGRSLAYVIDCSGSMTARGSLNVAKRELLFSLDQIPPESQFAVVFYNLEATVFTDLAGNPGLMAATPANKARVKTLLSGVQPDGGTDHMLALKAAFNLHPEVIFFLTDADLMSRQDVEELVALAGKTRIQAIEFGQVTGLGGSAPLKLLAKQTGGTYRYIDVNRFVR